MFRLTQTVRNLFLRLQGLLSVLFKSVSNFVGNFFGLFAKLFGFTKSDYFLESNQEQGIKQASAKEPIETNQDNTPKISATTRRRPNAKIDDYFLNMARDVKKN
ncbi:threonine dehydratase [uncultured Nostoc sp.]|uniref:threonine dehydratase n=1 Tax=uncultured Nostoc sp. TaxID=340711 RepID=UPI0035CBD8BF